MGFVASAVSSAVSWVGDAVESVVDFAVDEILEPVIDMASGVVKGMLDDPITTIAMIAAAVTPGMQWAVPLIAGASTAIQGGDIGDIALAVASSYVGSKVGPIVGDFVGAEVGGAVGSEVVGRIAGEAAAGAARGVITAAATGGDIGRAALMGAASGAGRASFSEAGSYIREGMAASEAEVAVDGTGYGSADVGMEYFESSDFVDNFNAATESIGIELSDIVDTWDSIPEIAQDVITSAAGATISSLAMTGEMPSDKQLASAVTSAAIASKATSRALTNVTGVSDKSAAQIAKVISDVSRTAYTGADPYEAYKASLSGVFQEDLNKAIDEVTSGGLDALFDNIAGSTAAYEVALGGAEEKSLLVDVAAEGVNDVIDQAEALRAGQVEGFYSYEEWEQEKNAFEAGGRTDRAAYDRLNAWNAKYAEITAPLSNLRAVYDEQVLNYNAEIDKVKAAEQALFTDQEYLDQAAEPIRAVANEGFTKALRPDFNETEYRELNNLSPDTDAHGHWLATGRSNPVNKQDFDTQINETLKQKFYNLSVSQEDKKWRSLEDFNKFESGLVDAAKAVIGDDLNAARNLDLSADPTLTPVVAAINAYINDAPDLSRSAVEAVAEPIAKTPGTTDANIASGKARLVAVNKLLKASTATAYPDSFASPVVLTDKDFILTDLAFDPQFNQPTRKVYSPVDNEFVTVDANGKELSRVVGGDVLPDGTIVESSVFGAPVEISPLLPPMVPPTLQQLSKINGIKAIETASGLKLSEEEYDNLDFTNRMLLNFAVGVKNVTQWANDTEVDIRKELGIGDEGTDKEIAARAWTRDFQRDMGNIVEAGGELYKEWSGMSALFNVDPRTLNSTVAAKLLIGIGASTKPEDYKATLALFKEYRDNDPNSETYGEIIGDGILGKAQSIALAMADPQFREVVLHDVIIKEAITELPTIVAAVATGGIAGVAVAGAKKGAQKFAKDAAEDAAKKIARRTAIGTGAVLNAGEEASSAAGQAYEMIYDAAIEGGKSEAEATKLAHNGAITQGALSAAVTVPLSFMPGNPTKELIQIAFGGKKRLGELVGLAPKIVGKYTLGTVAEIGEEVTQEAAIQTYLLSKMVRDINPNASVFKKGGAFHDMDGALANAAVYSAVSSGGTSTILNAANAAINVANAIPAGKNLFDSYLEGVDVTTPQALLPSPTSGNTNNPAANALIAFNPTINQAANDAGSSNPEVRAAGETKIREVFGYDPNYQFDGTTIDVAQDPDGVYRFNTAVDILNAANDNSYNTLGEVQSGFSENTAGVPFVPSSADIQRFVGAAPDVTQAPDVAPVPSTDVLRAGINDFIDQNYTDADEVADYFTSLGYGPSQTEVQQFTGQTPETTQLATIDPYVDPRQTTTNEVLDYFTSLGYTPDQSEVALFTGQGAEDFQTTQFGAVDPYVDPRQVTRSEAEQFFADQNYTPTEDELTRFVTQANDPTFQTTQEQALTTEFDPLAVTEGEARTAFETAGFFDALPADVTRLTGQYAESDLGGRVQEALPVATYNSIANMLGKSGQEVTTSDVDFVADIIAQQEVLTEPTPFTQEQLQYDVNADNVVDIADQTMLQQVMAGTVPQTQLASTSQFAATGIQGQIQQQTQMQQQLQQQIQTQEADRLKRQTQQNQQAYMQQLLETSPVEVKTPDPASIDYVYDPFGESIFATPQQEGLFVDPFTQRNAAAQGGIVSALGGRR